MAAPWVAGAQGRIIGELHGQRTVNVLHFATNTAIADPGTLDTLLLQLAAAMLECVVDTLLPAVTSDWKIIQCDAKRIYPVASDPILATADADTVGALGSTEVSFASALVNLRTGSGGKRGRGRMFLPPPGRDDITGSTIGPGILTDIAAFLACVAGKFLGAGATTDWRLGILSRKDLTSTGGTFDNSFRVVSSLNPVADLAVMRSRRKGHGA